MKARYLACRIAAVAMAVVTLVLVAAVALSPLTGIRLLSVESASMSPAIAVGDVAVAVPGEPSGIREGDIVSFVSRGGIVTHRVVANRTSLGELATKGDANEQPDIEPVPYANVIGSVSLVVPQAQPVTEALSTPVGKVYVAVAALCAVLLWVRGGQLAKRIRERGEAGESGGDASDEQGSPGGDAPRKGRHGVASRAVVAVLAIVFVASLSLILRYRLTQNASVDAMAETRDRYSDDTPGAAPKSVDFAAMRAANPDVIGWLYCEGTPIDYPVVRGQDNDWYLRRNWLGEEDMCGSIFADAASSPDFSDARTVVYGHHMNDDLMFACLDSWADQGFYDEHPAMWLLTPEGDYRMELVAGEHIPATSDAYVPAKGNDEAFRTWLSQYVGSSDFKSRSSADPDAKYVMLSTCAYVYEDARYTLLGKLARV